MPTPSIYSSEAETREVPLDRLPVGVFRAPMDGRLLHANDAPARILGNSARDSGGEIVRADGAPGPGPPSLALPMENDSP